MTSEGNQGGNQDTSNRGFAAMDPEKQKEVASKGGQASSEGGNQAAGGQGAQGKRSGSNRGFAAMDERQQREIASKGGKAAHRSGNAHEFTSEEARAAGRRGGEVVSQNRSHMAQIGREGGLARGNRGGNQTSQRSGSTPEDRNASGNGR